MNKKFDCQVGEVFPIVDRESASNIVLVQQAFVVCNALRSESYSYEKFLVEFKLLESNSSDPKELLNAEFDDCWLYPEVATDRELGEYIVDEIGFELSRETLERYFDYEKFGRDVRLEEGGSFVDRGYFVSR